MKEKIIEKSNRFITVNAYQQQTGLSYSTVMNGTKTGQIPAIQTEGGHYRVDTQSSYNPDNAAVLERLEETQRLLKAQCKQFNTAVN